jgi:hypothetical protein
MIEKRPRYRHKLNMLEPAIVMFKAMGGISAFGIVLYLCNIRFISYILFGAVGFMLFVLLILLCVEQHQDKVLYLDSKKDDPDIK